MEGFEQLFTQFIFFFSYILELLGALAIIIYSFHSFSRFLRKPQQSKKESIQITLAKGLAIGLQFKLAGEILKTSVVRTMDDILFLAGIVALRGAINLLIHWEITIMSKEAGG